jgi:hypothetical protein
MNAESEFSSLKLSQKNNISTQLGKLLAHY